MNDNLADITDRGLERMRYKMTTRESLHMTRQLRIELEAAGATEADLADVVLALMSGQAWNHAPESVLKGWQQLLSLTFPFDVETDGVIEYRGRTIPGYVALLRKK